MSRSASSTSVKRKVKRVTMVQRSEGKATAVDPGDKIKRLDKREKNEMRVKSVGCGSIRTGIVTDS